MISDFICDYMSYSLMIAPQGLYMSSTRMHVSIYYSQTRETVLFFSSVIYLVLHILITCHVSPAD